MDRIVVVTKPSRLEELVLLHHTEGAAKFVLESRGQSIEPYQREHAAYKAALAEIRRQLPGDIPHTAVSREGLPNFLFRDSDLIIACGPDGLFANLAKYVGDQSVLTVNPDPATVAGVLMLFSPSVVGSLIAKVREGKHRLEALPFVKAVVDNEQVLRGINDIFIGRKDPVSARYEISYAGHQEHQSSSGILVSTGTGAPGWMRSVVAMINGLTRESTAHKLSILPDVTSSELVFVVREPFPSPMTGTSIVTGRVVPNRPLLATSEMPDGGFLFSDGVTEDALEWNAGSTVEISVGDRYINRIVG